MYERIGFFYASVNGSWGFFLARKAHARKTPNLILGPFTLAKTWVFCCTVYTARKTHNIRGFWHEKRMREKSESHTCVLVSGAHARLFSPFDRTRVVRITSRAAVGLFR